MTSADKFGKIARGIAKLFYIEHTDSETKLPLGINGEREIIERIADALREQAVCRLPQRQYCQHIDQRARHMAFGYNEAIDRIKTLNPHLSFTDEHEVL